MQPASARSSRPLSRHSHGERRRDPIGNLFRLMIVIWSAICFLWMLLSLLLGWGTANNLNHDPQQHETVAAAGCLASSIGTAVGGVAWIVGMIPLAILYMVFRRRGD